MKYKISNIIKEMQELESSGKKHISEKELLQEITPKVNKINDDIEYLEDLESKPYIEKNLNVYRLSKLLEGKITRETLHQWVKKGIITIHHTDDNNVNTLNISELINSLKRIREIHNPI